MNQIRFLAAAVVCGTLMMPRLAAAQTTPAILPALTTPDRVDTRIGPLDSRPRTRSTRRNPTR
jgi:hypothetical protein